MVLFFCAILPVKATDFGIGVAGNIGMAFSEYKLSIVDENGNIITDHLSSREPAFTLGPEMELKFNNIFSLNLSLQYGRYNYNYTYDYATSSDAIEMEWHYTNLIFPVSLKFTPKSFKNIIYIGGGIILYKQLSGEFRGNVWGHKTGIQEVPNEYLRTGIIPQLLLGAEFHSDKIGYQTSINYYYGIDGVDLLFDDSSSTSTQHLSLNISILYYFNKDN